MVALVVVEETTRVREERYVNEVQFPRSNAVVLEVKGRWLATGNDPTVRLVICRAFWPLWSSGGAVQKGWVLSGVDVRAVLSDAAVDSRSLLPDGRVFTTGL